jgi:hypothetical protein
MLSRSTRATVALIVLIPQLAGCYTYVPVSTAPLGSSVTVEVTDRGRVALTESVGPGVRRLSGQVTASNDSAVHMSVNTVQFLDVGTPVKWAGEPVTISRDYVVVLREKRLSRSRSFIAAGLFTAAGVAMSMIAIRGFGGDDPSGKPGDGGGGGQQ